MRERLDYIASDIHLGATGREKERRFVSFLEHVGRDGRTLLLAGDLFDFWFEYGEVVPGRHFRVLAALAALVDAGVPVTLLGGNHDGWGGRFLRDEVGVAFHAGSVRLELGGRPALAVHGDGLGSGDVGYKILKAVIRSRPAVAGFRVLHPELGTRLARSVSKTAEHAAAGRVDTARAAAIEGWARGALAAAPELAWVVCGHTHQPAIVEVEPGRYYLNAGDWLVHDSYITVDGGGVPRLERWGGQAARS
jgi:UDP-2,3-diacylglucosamine hydrolase